MTGKFWFPKFLIDSDLGHPPSNNDLSLVAQLKLELKQKIKRLIDATAKNKIYRI